MIRQIRTSLRNNLIAGVLVLAPIGVVFWFVVWLWTYVFGLTKFLPSTLDPTLLFGIENPVALRLTNLLTSIFLFILILTCIWAVGLISRNYLGRRIIDGISKLMGRVPVVSTIYSTLEQLMKTFASGKGRNFRRVVYVEYPRNGIYTLALVTTELEKNPITGQPGKYVSIFVPTTPNPTSGFYLTLSASDVIDAPVTVEQALKEIISMGMVHGERNR